MKFERERGGDYYAKQGEKTCLWRSKPSGVKKRPIFLPLIAKHRTNQKGHTIQHWRRCAYIGEFLPGVKADKKRNCVELRSTKL
jgi:hypothetical protein